MFKLHYHIAHWRAFGNTNNITKLGKMKTTIASDRATAKILAHEQISRLY
jgi:hypothetical protein